MFISLSSGATPRYAKNIFHALAQPAGSRLQFRYDESIVGNSANQAFEQGHALGQKCLLAYLDLADPAQRDITQFPEIVPCRYGLLESVEHAGTTFVLIFVLTDFAYAKSLPDFNTELRTATSNTMPFWKGAALDGQFCSLVKDELNQVINTTSLTDWEQIVSQIAPRFDFRDRSSFYTVKGLYQLGATRSQGKNRAISTIARTEVSVRDGLYDLDPGHEYELQLYQFYPVSGPPIQAQPGSTGSLSRFTNDTSIDVESSNDALTFTTGKSLAIDSPYDVKIFRFRTSKPRTDQVSLLSLMLRVNHGDPNLDFDLPIKIEGATFSTIWAGAGLGFLLALPHIIEALKPEAPKVGETSARHADLFIILLYVVIYVSAGILAAFGIGKIPGD
jgi:hypothetical protein